ncbi:MAG: hypothetical protein ACRBCS_16065 [Cellvibrionaceae bacterium]
MTNGFEPQKVDAKSITQWFKNGLELASRNPLAYLILVSCFAGVSYLPDILSSIFIFIMPILLGAGCIIADACNKQTSSLNEVKDKPVVVWLRLLLLGLIPWAPLMIISLIGTALFGPGEPPHFEKYEGRVAFEGGASILALMFLWFITMGYYLWFMVPLISVAGLSLELAFDQATDALGLNRFVAGLVVLLSFSCFVGMVWSVLVFPWIAIVTSMMYVSYRHIWFGGSGVSKKVKASVGLAATASNLT